MFVLLAIGAALVNFTSISCFGIAAERFTKRVRSSCFEVILKQGIKFDPKYYFVEIFVCVRACRYWFLR